MINYRLVSVLAAILLVSLFAVLLLQPALIFWLFGLEQHGSTAVIARRAAMLFLTLAIIVWMGRNAPHSPLRQTVALAMAVGMAALAVLGFSEFLLGSVGPGIFVAISGEIVFAFAYLHVWRDNR